MLNQDHIRKVVDMLNVSRFEFTDLSTSVVCLFLTLLAPWHFDTGIPTLMSFQLCKFCCGTFCTVFLLLTQDCEFRQILG
jgi:hypothetical protein